MVRQVFEEYEVKDPTLKAYSGLVKQLWQNFSQIQLTQIPREENSRADELSRVDPSDPRTTKGILIETLNRPSTVMEEVMIIETPDWRSPIIEYLKNPATDTKSESAKLRIRTARYILIDDVLYKKIFQSPIPQVSRSRRSTLCLEGNPWRHLWKSSWQSIPLSQST